MYVTLTQYMERLFPCFKFMAPIVKMEQPYHCDKAYYVM